MDNSPLNLFLTLCFSVCPVIPFAVTDIYYSYITSYVCLDHIDYNISNILNMRLWIKVNGYISLSSVIFIFFVFSVIYNNKCPILIRFLQHNIFIKSYIFLKIPFNIAWTILGSILFYRNYTLCPFNLQFYIWFRLSIMFVFIIMSLKSIKHQLIDSETSESIEREIIHTNT